MKTGPTMITYRLDCLGNAVVYDKNNLGSTGTKYLDDDATTQLANWLSGCMNMDYDTAREWLSNHQDREFGDPGIFEEAV